MLFLAGLQQPLLLLFIVVVITNIIMIIIIVMILIIIVISQHQPLVAEGVYTRSPFCKVIMICHSCWFYRALEEKTKGMSRESEEKAKKAFEEEVMTKASKAFDWEKEKDPDIKRKRTKMGMKHLDKILSKTNLVISFTLVFL